MPSLPRKTALQGEEVEQQPRALGRLRKARSAAENVQPNLTAPSSSPAKSAISDASLDDRGEPQLSSPADAADSEGVASPSRQVGTAPCISFGIHGAEHELASVQEEDAYYDEEDELEQNFVRTQRAEPADDGEQLCDGSRMKTSCLTIFQSSMTLL